MAEMTDLERAVEQAARALQAMDGCPEDEWEMSEGQARVAVEAGLEAIRNSSEGAIDHVAQAIYGVKVEKPHPLSPLPTWDDLSAECQEDMRVRARRAIDGFVDHILNEGGE